MADPQEKPPDHAQAGLGFFHKGPDEDMKTHQRGTEYLQVRDKILNTSFYQVKEKYSNSKKSKCIYVETVCMLAKDKKHLVQTCVI